MEAHKATLFSNLETIGIYRNDIVLVHSSYSALGAQRISAELFLSYLIEYLNEGTVLFPSLSYKFVTPSNPCFDSTKTKSCVGYLSEVFRTKFSSHRSIHPTHSVSSVGKQAELLTAHHYKDDTPCGKHSPFSLLPKYGGKILMLGCGLNPNTSMHAIEETVLPPYLFGERIAYTLVDNQRRLHEKTYITHDFKGYAQRYDRIINANTNDWIQNAKIFEADSFVLPAEKLWQVATALYTKDPFHFVAPIVS